jgi:hypothetical protein
MNSKKILYIDMDNVLVDFASGIAHLIHPLRKPHFGCFEHFADGENPIPVFLRLARTDKTPFWFFYAFRRRRKSHFVFFGISQVAKGHTTRNGACPKSL